MFCSLCVFRNTARHAFNALLTEPTHHLFYELKIALVATDAARWLSADLLVQQRPRATLSLHIPAYVCVWVWKCRPIYMRAHLLGAVCHLCVLLLVLVFVLVIFFDYQTIGALSAPAATTSTPSSTHIPTHIHFSCIQMISHMIKSAHTQAYTHTYTPTSKCNLSVHTLWWFFLCVICCFWCLLFYATKIEC